MCGSPRPPVSVVGSDGSELLEEAFDVAPGVELGADGLEDAGTGGVGGVGGWVGWGGVEALEEPCDLGLVGGAALAPPSLPALAVGVGSLGFEAFADLHHLHEERGREGAVVFLAGAAEEAEELSGAALGVVKDGLGAVEGSGLGGGGFLVEGGVVGVDAPGPREICATHGGGVDHVGTGEAELGPGIVGHDEG